MNKELELVEEFHRKFDDLVSDKPALIPSDRSNNRYDLMKAEVDEYAEGVREEDLQNVAKELADILYAVYGTIIEHGLQHKMEDVFREVHRSNMSKEYHQYKMIKGDHYSPADVGKILDH